MYMCRGKSVWMMCGPVAPCMCQNFYAYAPVGRYPVLPWHPRSTLLTVRPIPFQGEVPPSLRKRGGLHPAGA